MPAAPPQPRSRDADRSREALLSAAERLFSARGFDAASLSEIGAEAGLSRGSPNYFFGSKERLYREVLQRAFREREDAARGSFAPVTAWAERGAGIAGLERALRVAVEGHTRFLVHRPAFVRLMEWEALAGGERLLATPRESRAMQDAFEAVRGVADQRGLARFDPDDAVTVCVVLCFTPVAYRATFMARMGRDLEDPAELRRYSRLIAGQLLHIIAPARRAD